MSAINIQCPPEAMLSDFGLGKLDAAKAETISQHLETCADCRERVANLSGDSFVNRLRGVPDGASPERIEHTFVGGDSASNASASSDTPWGKPPEDGLPRPSRTVDEKAKRDGPGGPSSAPPELANHLDYEILKELGRGGMGVVYLAKNRMMDRLEVLKVVSKALLDKPGALERFQQEIRSAAKLLHPNIVAAHAVLRPGDLLVFAMEYVPGQDLMQVVKKRGYLPIANATFYAHQVALGLQHAHEKGMVHRDIKPNNLMLAIEGKKHVVKILDFGLAKATSEKAAETALTKSGQMLGTPDYIAPEQTLDAHQADIRADIYSLGCTLYYFLAGRPPFQEASLYALLDAHQRREAQPLNLVRPEVPVELAAVVGKMLAKDPAKRYQTPIEVARALTPFFKPGQSAASTTAAAGTETSPPQAHANAETVVGAVSPTETWLAAQPVALAPVLPQPASPAVPIPLRSAVASPVTSISIDTHRAAERQPGWWKSRPPWQLYTITAGAAALLLMAIVLTVQTPHGTIEIALSDNNAKVSVTIDKDKIDIGDLDEPLSLLVGEHDLKVTGKGYETFTKNFTVTKGKNAPLTVTLVPRESVADEPAPALAKPAKAAGQLGSMTLEHNNQASCCRFSPNGKLLATGGQDGVVKIWDATTGKKLHELAIRETVQDVTFSPDSKILLTWTGKSPRGNSAKWKPKFWDSATAKEITDFPITRPIVGPLAFSADGAMIAVAATEGSVELYDKTGKPLGSLAGERGDITCLAFSPDGKLLASGSDARMTKLWKIADKSEVLSLEDGQKSSFMPSVHTVLFSRDGRLLVVGINANTLVYDLKTSQTLWKKRTNTWRAFSLAISPDNKFVVSAGGQGDGDHFVVSDALTGQRIQTVRAWKAYQSGNRGAEAIALSPDGRTLASAGPDHTIKIWDTATWEEHAQTDADISGSSLPKDHEREVAEWVLSISGKVTVEGSDQPVSRIENLPVGSIRLKGIDLENASIQDEDLTRIQHLPDLQMLRLVSTAIGDAGLVHLVDLPRLRNLNLSGSKVTSAGARFLGRYPRLSALYLSGPTVDDNFLDEVCKLPGLSFLDMGKLALTNAGLRHLKKAKGLQTLSIESRALGDEELRYLRDLPIYNLHLWDTSATGKGLTHIASLPQLQELWLHDFTVDDNDLAELERLPLLHKLVLSSTPITDAGCEHLKKCKSLKELNLTGTQMTQQGLSLLRAALPNCKIESSIPAAVADPPSAATSSAKDHEREVAEWVLSKGGTIVVDGADGAVSQAAKLPAGPIKIQQISLNKTAVTDAELGRLHDLPSLTRLSIDAGAITDAGLAKLKNLPNLRGLSVAYTKVTGAGMKYVKQFERLTDLFLYGSRASNDGMRDIQNLRLECLVLNGTRVTGDGLRQLKDLPLRSLSLAGLAIGDDDMVLLQGMRTLREIELQETHVGDAGLEHLKALTQLTKLSLMKTNVSSAGVKALQTALPNCKINWP